MSLLLADYLSFSNVIVNLDTKECCCCCIDCIVVAASRTNLARKRGNIYGNNVSMTKCNEMFSFAWGGGGGGLTEVNHLFRVRLRKLSSEWRTRERS